MMKKYFKSKASVCLLTLGAFFSLSSACLASEAEMSWMEAVQPQENSPCLKDFTRECLLNEAAKYYNLSEKVSPAGDRYVPSNILPPVNVKLAESYLARWPKDEGIFLTEHEKALKYSAQMLLLFAAGRYAEAEQMVDEKRAESKGKTIQDGSPIALLTFKGDLEKAYELALKDMAWLGKNKQPEPKEDFYTAMHCGSQQFFPSPLPLALEFLSEAYTEKGDYARAYEVAGMIKSYLKNSAYGQGTCAMGRATTPYFNAMHILADGYLKAGQKESAQKVLLEIRKDIIDELLGGKTNHAYISAYLGFTEGLKEFADQAAQEFKTEIYSFSEFDPISLLYFYAKDYEGVFQRLSQLDKIATEIQILKEKRDKNQDPFFSSIIKEALEGFISPKDPPGLDVAIKTCLKMISVGRELEDFEGERIIAEKLEEKYLGYRNDPLANVRDYVSFAEALYAMGDVEKSKATFQRAVSIFDGVTLDDAAYRKFHYDLLDIAKLYAKHHSLEKAVAFIRSFSKYEPKRSSLYPEYWAANYLIQEKRFEELDPFIPMLAAVLTTDDSSSLRLTFSHSKSFTNILLREKQFVRYVSVLDATKGEARYNLAYVFLIYALNNPDVPDDLLRKIWTVYLNGCGDYTYIFQGKRISHEEKISNCLVFLADQSFALQMDFLGGYSNNPVRKGWRR